MKPLLIVMNKVVVAGFYTANAAMFLIVLGFCFGFMRGSDHVALAEYFAGSPALTLVPVAVWIIYALLVIRFNNELIAKDTSNVLYGLPLAVPGLKWPVLVTAAFNQMVPAIAYGMLIVAVAARSGLILSIVIIASTLIVLVILVAWRMHVRLVYPSKEVETLWIMRWLDRRYSKPMSWIFVEGVTRMQPSTVYGAKIFSCLVAYGALQLYNYDTYDARLYSMAACTAFSANLTIVFLYQKFEVGVFNITRSLPITLNSRLIQFIISIMILCVPEILILTINIPEQVSLIHAGYAIAFGISLAMFGYGALYVRDADFDSFTKWIFFVTMAWLMLILFGTPLLVGAVIQAGLGVYLFKSRFYAFQQG